MKRLFKFLPLALLFFGCDNSTVPQADYDALLAKKQELEAENDSLQFEIQDLRLYNDYLETTLDSLQQGFDLQ